ncbi:MAG: MFS transporter [Bryobacterales bacterium]|nr:MFS transporter [Bryobacterales bacterium]
MQESGAAERPQTPGPGEIAGRAGVPPVASASAFARTFRTLRHRNFRLYLGGLVVSLAGTWMQTVAQSWLVYRLTRSEWLMGATWFCIQAPVLALGPLGGIVSDRYSRLKIVRITQVLSMLQAFALAALTLSGRVEPWHILSLGGVLGAINAFDMPARNALIIHLTGKDELLSAISLNSTVFNAARVVGPALAGLLVAAVGEGWCFLLNGVSFLAVIGSLLAIRLDPVRPAVQPASTWTSLADGFRYAGRNPALRPLLTLMALTTLANMPLLVLIPFFAGDIFGRGSEGLGTLMAAMGGGAMVGVLALASRDRIDGLPRLTGLSALALGAGYLAFSVAPSYWVALVLMPAIGFSLMRMMASANTLIQSVVEEGYRGRVMAMYTMTVVGLGPFGSLAAGALAGWTGPRAVVAAGGLLCIVAAMTLRAKASAISDELTRKAA